MVELVLLKRGPCLPPRDRPGRLSEERAMVATKTIWSRVTGIIETHVVGCRALNKATRRPAAVWIEVDDEGKADLIEREYPARTCKCVPRGA